MCVCREGGGVCVGQFVCCLLLSHIYYLERKRGWLIGLLHNHGFWIESSPLVVQLSYGVTDLFSS